MLIAIRHAALAGIVLAASTAGAAAQAPAAATHKHYEVSDHAMQPGPNGELAPRLQNLGTHAFPVSTRNVAAQRFINQGLNLAYAFNHAEARRAFREAARLDPTLAIAYWGQALVLGPNINAVMEPNEEPQAYELIKKAQSLKSGAAPRERALIDALEKRYSGSADHRTANDQAYAAAMRAVHQQFPADLDIAMLYVESMMDLRPWGYWTPDGRPHEGTAEIVALTEEVHPPSSEAPRRAAHAHPPARAHGHAGTGRDRRRRAPAADAGRRPHGAHGLAHLSARGPLRRRDAEQPAGHRRRRRLHHAVPGPGALSDGLLPAQHPLPVVRGDRRRCSRRWPSIRRPRSPPRFPTRCWPKCRSPRDSGSCPTGPTCGSDGGT